MKKLVPNVLIFKLSKIGSDNYENAFFALTEAITETIFGREETVHTLFTGDWEDRARSCLRSYGVTILAEKGHFCCYYDHRTKRLNVIFWTDDMRPEDRALIVLLIEKYLGKCRLLPAQSDGKVNCISLILPQTPWTDYKTDGLVLTEELQLNAIAFCNLCGELPSSEAEDLINDPNYTLLTNKGYIIRHINYGETLLTVFVWEEFNLDQLPMILPEYAWKYTLGSENTH